MFCSRLARRLACALCMASTCAVAPAAASAKWTFCVAESGDENDNWITGVFEAPRDRLKLEGEFQAYLRARGLAGSVVQCPAAKDDEAEIVGAHFMAEQFHLELGDALHEIPLSEFSPKRWAEFTACPVARKTR